MGDLERDTLAKELQAFRRENADANNTILERLDGKLGPSGTLEGGLCETVKSHDRLVRRFQKWESAVVGGLIASFTWWLINGHFLK